MNMFENKTPTLSSIISSVIGEINIETVFAEQVADENNWHYIGVENGSYKFHDIEKETDVFLTFEECVGIAISCFQKNKTF